MFSFIITKYNINLLPFIRFLLYNCLITYINLYIHLHINNIFIARERKIMAKTYNNKRDFIEQLMSMTDTEINDYIKQNGKQPKNINKINKMNKKKYNKYK